jgi:hypothetical protein
MPASLRGIHLPGNERSVDGSLRLVGELRLAGRAYTTMTRTLANEFVAGSEGVSAGFRYFRSGWRLDLRGSHREWSFGQAPTTARTATLSLGVPMGPFSFNGFADLGQQDNGTIRQPTSSYRGSALPAGRDG